MTTREEAWRPHISRADRRQWIITAQMPFDESKLAEHDLAPVEWVVYSDAEIPRLLKKKEFFETLYRVVFVRECSDTLQEVDFENLQRLESTRRVSR